MTNLPSASTIRTGVTAIYDDKPPSYFADARADIVQLLETGPNAAILELGCGAGGTGRATLSAGKAGRFVGIELNPTAAETASKDLTQVLVGDVEQMDLSGLENDFDALIISEVLEHLTAPWETLERLAKCLKPNGVVFASSPNISHWKVIHGLLMGRFQYDDYGVMDRTHLRWFTPTSYHAMFEAADIAVHTIRPISPISWKGRLINGMTGGRFRHLFMTQIMVVGRKR